MSGIDHYILGDVALYGRLCVITEVLGKFVSAAPRAVTLAQISNQTGRPVRELTRLCNALCRDNLLRPDPDQAHSWLLACEASQVTLEDAFRCVVAEQAARSRTARQKAAAERESTPLDVDLLVTQASMEINQSVFQHLRQFSLDRLKMTAAGMFPRKRESSASWPHGRPLFT